MIKRLILLLGVVSLPLIVGLLFTYDVLKLEWISTMEIQESFGAQEDPLPLPAGSVPVQGAAYVEGLGAPVNPLPADAASLARGQQYYSEACALCHGPKGDGRGQFAVFLSKVKPPSLLEGDPKTSADGVIFLAITKGVNGVMPPLKENLPEANMRWDVVNYVRELQKAAP